MNQTVWGATAVVVAAVISYLTARVSGRRSVEIAKLPIDERAFERAEKAYEGSISELNSRVSRLEMLLRRHERRADQLETALRDRNIPVPPWLPDHTAIPEQSPAGDSQRQERS